MARGTLRLMARWAEFEKDAPEFAARVRVVLDRHKHKTLATLRGDGSPRISGAEIQFAGADVLPARCRAR